MPRRRAAPSIRRLGLAALLLLALRATAEVSGAEAERIAEIVRLRQRIHELEQGLGEEARQELARLLEELATVDPPAAGAPEAPPPAPPRCDLLAFLDSDGDGEITALDRYWRHLFAWIDGDGDARLADDEVQHVFDLGVRSISAAARDFRTEKGGGEVRRGGALVLVPLGRAGGEGTLVLDATRLARGSGPQLLDSDAQPLSGLQPLRSGLGLRDSDGSTVRFGCP